MDLRRVRRWDWLAGIAGAVLIASLFLHWYGVGLSGGRGVGIFADRTTATAWQAFAVTDIVLLIAGLFGVAIVVITATQRTASLAQAVSSSSVLPILVATVVAVVRVIDPPSWTSLFSAEGVFLNRSSGTVGPTAPTVTREAGLWIGLGAVLTLLVACWRAMGDQRFPAPARSRVEVTHMRAPEVDAQ